jgi:hypothetical protein
MYRRRGTVEELGTVEFQHVALAYTGVQSVRVHSTDAESACLRTVKRSVSSAGHFQTHRLGRDRVRLTAYGWCLRVPH